MNLNTLEKMCRALACQPGDVLTLAHGKQNGRKVRKNKK